MPELSGVNMREQTGAEMRQSNAFRRIMVLLLKAIIIIGQTYIFWHFWNEYYSENIESVFFFKGHIVILFVYALLFGVFANVYGAFQIGRLRFGDMLFSQMLSVCFVNIVMYLQISLLSLEMVAIAPMLGMCFDNLLCAVAWCAFSKCVYGWLYPPRDLLLVYCDRDPDRLVQKVNTRKDKYKIKESIHVNKGLEEVYKAIRKHEAVLLCDIPSDTRNDIIKYCYGRNTRVYVTPKLSDIILMGSESNNLFDSPLFITKNRGLKWEQAFLKRMFDIVVALILCIPTIIVTIIVAVCDFFDDRGPVFYTQERLTLEGRKFKILKFRSMRVDSEKEGARLAAKDDDRITPIGKVLRATHLDELPQVFNILIGDMSVVGPRPERPEIAEEYEENIPEFSFRLKVKAGLTGYAQVYGKYNTTPYDKLKLDLYYIQHYSFWLDFKLIFLTFKIMFMKDNTEGIEKDQTTATNTKDVLKK